MKAARIEVEFFSRRSGYLRLQYDAVEGDNHKPYKSAASDGPEMINLGTVRGFTRLVQSNGWQTVAFRVADGAFGNSQNGGADFRFEITPPEIYVRRVRVTRETAPPPQQSAQ